MRCSQDHRQWGLCISLAQDVFTANLLSFKSCKVGLCLAIALTERVFSLSLRLEQTIGKHFNLLLNGFEHARILQIPPAGDMTFPAMPVAENLTFPAKRKNWKV